MRRKFDRRPAANTRSRSASHPAETEFMLSYYQWQPIKTWQKQIFRAQESDKKRIKDLYLIALHLLIRLRPYL